MQSPGWQPILLVAWCQFWWFASKEELSCMTLKCPCCNQVSLNCTKLKLKLCSLPPLFFSFYIACLVTEHNSMKRERAENNTQTTLSIIQTVIGFSLLAKKNVGNNFSCHIFIPKKTHVDAFLSFLSDFSCHTSYSCQQWYVSRMWSSDRWQGEGKYSGTIWWGE